MLDGLGVALCLGAVVGAPLLVGGVHRPTLIALLCASTLGLASLCIALAVEGRQLRGDVVLSLPLVLLAIPLIQAIPLPYGLRGLVDRAGTALLLENQPAATASWPLSLDPVATRVDVGRAAAALAAFFFAFHLAAGQKRRHLMMRAIGIVGVAAVAIGLGHRVFGVEKLYGAFKVPMQTLVVGPLVNRNHTAELLELAAFVCLASALQKPTLLNRTTWLAGTALCAGGAAATLSRGAALGLGAGVTAFAVLQFLGPSTKDRARRPVAVMWGAALGALVVVGMLSLGADGLISRFKADGVSTDLRFRLWRDGLRVLAAHPAGIGRGAFDRVFPIYRTLKMPFPIRFAFLENEPFQFLVDCGWWLFVPIVLCFSIGVGRIVRGGQRDSVENALCAALIAVLAHSVVDFGLETMGVLLPFSAVAGTLFGRIRSREAPQRIPAAPARWTWAVAAFAGFGMLFGIVSTVHSSNDDFDALLNRAHDRSQKLAIIKRAERTHPLDYFYALDRAALEPVTGSPSPRLHALNRALRLCPACDTVHDQVARTLWTMGLRRQALLEWRTAVDLQPVLLQPLVAELLAKGLKPQELVSLAVHEPQQMLEVVDFIARRGRLSDAFVALDQADAAGAPHGDALLTRASLNLEADNLDAAATAAAAAAAAGVQGPRLPLVQATILLKQHPDDGVDQALALLDSAASRYPTDLAVQRERVRLVTRYKKWTSAARAIDGLKFACYHATGSPAEAHVAAAGISLDMGRVNEALGEYRMALADRPNDMGLWMTYGRAAETAGRPASARDAYTQAARLDPSNPVAKRALQNLDDYEARLRAQSAVNPDHLPLPGQ